MYRIALSLGRYNPPTLGHYESLMRLKVQAEERGLRPEVFVIDGEQSGKDRLKNPLSAEKRIEILKSWVPEIHFDIASSAYEVMEILEVQNKRPEIWIAGSDRASRYGKLLDFAGFKNSKVIELDRTKGIAAGVSATKARQAAAQGDYETFRNMMPEIDNNSHKEIYGLLRKALTEDGAE